MGQQIATKRKHSINLNINNLNILSLVTFAPPSARTYEPFSRQGKAVLGKCFWGKAGRDETAFFLWGWGPRAFPFVPWSWFELVLSSPKAEETNEANKGVKQPNCVCGGSLRALQCIKSLWTLKDQMSGNLLVWLDHFSLETQITPVEVKKNFNNMVDHFKWRHPTSFDGADDENRQLWCWQNGGDDIESTPALRFSHNDDNEQTLFIIALFMVMMLTMMRIWWRLCRLHSSRGSSTLKVVVLQREKGTTHMLRQLSPPCILSSSFSKKLTIWRRLTFQHFT